MHRLMDTVAKPALRGTDRLRQTLAALARLLDQTMNDLQTVDSEFQERLLKTAQEMEESVGRQTAERVRAAIEEAEQNTRSLVTDELEASFKQQMTAAVEAAREGLMAEQAALSQELDRLKQASAEWEGERTRLLAQCERANQLLEQRRDEHDRALAETDEAAAIALERQI